MRQFVPPPNAIRVQATIDIAAPPEHVVALYSDVDNWNKIFPATIEQAKVTETGENWKEVEVTHTKEGRVPTLATLDLYTRRAVATARKMGWKDFHWLSVFSDGEPACGYKWLQTYSRTTIFCYEVDAMIFSKIVGWV